MTYFQQIKHPNWQRKRLEVLEENNFECINCGAKDQELHVHHPYYRKGAMVWEYESSELQCLCHKCHKDAHELDERIKKALALCRDKERVLGYISAMNCTFSERKALPISSYELAQGIIDYLSYDSADGRKKQDGYIKLLFAERLEAKCTKAI